MEKATAYAISAYIVSFGLWILIAGLNSGAPALWICAALIPIAIGLLSLFRPHLKSGCRGRRFIEFGPATEAFSLKRETFSFRSYQDRCGQLIHRASKAASPPFTVHCALETWIVWLMTWHCLSDVRNAISDASRPLPIRTMPSIGASRVGSMSHQPFSR